MELKIAFIGFGNVAREFARILHSRRDSLADKYRTSWRTAGIATGRHGSIVSHSDIDLCEAVKLVENRGSLTNLADTIPVSDAIEVIDSCQADIIFETTPLSPLDGEPAATYIRRSIESGIHVVTANKGPIACAYRELKSLAEAHNVSFRFEGTVMDGVPIYNLYEYCLNGARITGFSGVLNSTTNYILTGMEAGYSFDERLAEAQRWGIAEANADYDIDGWDAAVKAVALANVLMDANIHPREITPQGIRGISEADLKSARERNRTIRLLVRAELFGESVKIHVAPEEVADNSIFSNLQGTSNALTLQTDLMGEMSLIEENPGITQTAYALLSNMLRIRQERF